ncbi:MAG: (d)CMP kinase [Desulfobaccales bacterium]
MGPARLITIDGPAGAGKSTAARGLAKALGWTYLDSGAFYRLVAWQVRRHGVNPEDEAAVAGLLPHLTPEPGEDDHGFYLQVDGLRLSTELRTPEVSREASRVAKLPAVRRWVTDKLRRLAQGRRVVAEGRDLGTVVFPEADLKLYLEADLTIRAARRQQEQDALGAGGDLSATLSALAARDAQDINRAEAPLKVPEGAVIVDTSRLTPEEVVARCLKLAAERLEGV